VTFQPDVVVDAKDGRMWKLRLRLSSPESHAGIEAITDITKLVAFLQVYTLRTHVNSWTMY
jgi:hypothetical protein